MCSYNTLKFHCGIQTDVLVKMDTFSVVVVARVGLVSAESAADDLTDDLVHHEHQDCSD